MTKKQIRNYLKSAKVKGYSRAVISLDTNWVMVGEYCGKITDDKLVLHHIDLTIPGEIVINF